MWISNIEYLEVSLYSEQDAPIWTDPRPTTPPMLWDYLSYDDMILNHSYEVPDPEPSPDPTPDPTPDETVTPEPTATPQPDPEDMNESLNASFKDGYYNLVDGTVDGFFNPVYNLTDYISQPLTSLNHTLINFTVKMNESFNSSSYSLGLSSDMLFLIMLGMPTKIINVMTYYLIWIIILLIFKGDT